MELQTCRVICRQCCNSNLEEEQEQYTSRHINDNKNRLKHSQESYYTAAQRERNVFSFKFEESRKFEQSDKNTPLDSAQRNSVKPLVSQLQNLETRRVASPITIDRFYSPNLKQQKISLANNKMEGQRDSYELKSLLSPRTYNKPKVSFHFDNPPQPAQSGKMVGKRIKTVQQETEYSSKHSQVLFKTAFEIPESSTQKVKGEGHHVIFQQSSESSNNSIAGESLRTISECFPSSQEQTNSPIRIQHFNKGVTFQSIVTSTEIRSRKSSKMQNQLKLLRENQDQQKKGERIYPLYLNLNLSNSPNQNCSNDGTPQVYLSPRDEQNENMQIDPNIFYESSKKQASPRISVLNFSKHNQNQENDEQQELRDVIDHNFLISQQPSKNNSPKVSINPSLKNVNEYIDHSQKKPLSPFHSRENSWQFGPLMSARAKMKRTNTIESIESFSSEMISCLDIKFMQKNRGRRGVSRLI